MPGQRCLSKEDDKRNVPMSFRSNYGTIDGKEVIKAKTYSHLKPTAVDDDIYAVAEALASLQVPTIEEVLKVETSVLIPGV